MSKRFRPSRPSGRLLRPRSSRTSITGAPTSVSSSAPPAAGSPEAALENLEWKDEQSSDGAVLEAATEAPAVEAPRDAVAEAVVESAAAPVAEAVAPPVAEAPPSLNGSAPATPEQAQIPAST